jgi:hypothetical protein
MRASTKAVIVQQLFLIFEPLAARPIEEDHCDT